MKRRHLILLAGGLWLGAFALATAQTGDAAPRPAIPMPAGFPKDAPLPSGAKPVEASVRKDGTHHLTLQTQAAYADTTAFYSKQLAASGWEIGTKKDTGKAATFMADKDDRTLALGIFDRGGFRQITIEVDPPGKK